MKRISLLILFSILLWMAQPVHVSAQDASPTPENSLPAETETLPASPAPTNAPLGITSPKTGQALQGAIPITGFSALDGFVSSEVAFAYIDNPTDTWFIIQNSNSPITNGTLALWDTTTMADGNYNLRLRIFFNDGTTQQITVTDLRVRNYTPLDTATPTLTPLSSNTPSAALTITPQFTSTITNTPLPTPTPFPVNPITVQTDNLFLNFLKGIGAIILIFVVLTLLLRLRKSR